jgi:hypothetical protein
MDFQPFGQLSAWGYYDALGINPGWNPDEGGVETVSDAREKHGIPLEKGERILIKFTDGSIEEHEVIIEEKSIELRDPITCRKAFIEIVAKGEKCRIRLYGSNLLGKRVVEKDEWTPENYTKTEIIPDEEMLQRMGEAKKEMFGEE